MLKKIISILFILLVFCFYLHGQEKEGLQTAYEYKIGPQDLLEISVFGLAELNKTVRVSGDGKISLPLLGDIKVEGLTRGEVEKKLSQLLEKDYLQDPHVTVFIREYQSKMVSVLGAVAKPGAYELVGPQSLLQIISKAGGLTSEAGEEIIVFRGSDDGGSESIKIPVRDLIIQGDPELNIQLHPQDIVSVPVDEVVYVYVFGQVNRPGALEVKKSNIPTLLRAIAQAGGFSNRAAKGRVVIKKKDEQGMEINIKVNAKDIIKGKKEDIQLEENDVVFVPESIF